MTDAVVMTSLISLAVVTIVSLLVAAVAIKGSADRSGQHDRVMADLLETAVNAAVVSERDQVARLEAEHGRQTPESPPGAFAAVPGVPGNDWETTGDARDGPLD